MSCLEKRKRPSTSVQKTQIGRRLERLRRKNQNLWDDDDSDDDQFEQSRQMPNRAAAILLSDSDEEQIPSSSTRRRRRRSKRKLSRIDDEHLPMNANEESVATSATCLICSIQSIISSLNCCPQHLAALTNHHQWLPDQVMIVPVTDAILEQYLDPQKLHRLRAETPAQRRVSERQTSVSHTHTSMTDGDRVSPTRKSLRRTPLRSCRSDDRPSASTIAFEPAVAQDDDVPSELITIDDTPVEETMMNPWKRTPKANSPT